MMKCWYLSPLLSAADGVHVGAFIGDGVTSGTYAFISRVTSVSDLYEACTAKSEAVGKANDSSPGRITCQCLTCA